MTLESKKRISEEPGHEAGNFEELYDLLEEDVRAEFSQDFLRKAFDNAFLGTLQLSVKEVRDKLYSFRSDVSKGGEIVADVSRNAGAVMLEENKQNNYGLTDGLTDEPDWERDFHDGEYRTDNREAGDPDDLNFG